MSCLILFIIIYHVLLYVFKDLDYVKIRKKFDGPKDIKISDLNEKPLVNIVVPAWKEREEFRECLLSISQLSYPNIRVIVNAGGDAETMEIANTFRKYENFIILHQKGGSERAEAGKIRALNECFSYLDQGISYFIDADCYITDDLLLRMIYPITNLNEKVVIGGGIRPLISQQNIDLVRYLEVDKSRFERTKFARYNPTTIGGGNTTMHHLVLKKLGQFSEDRFYAEDVSRGQDVISQGFKIYWLSDYESFLYTHYPSNIKEFLIQKQRYVENRLLYSTEKKQIIGIIQFSFLYLFSIYMLIFPFLTLLHPGFLSIAIFILLNLYFNKIRRYFVFKKVIGKNFRKFPLRLWFKMIFYIYIEMISNIRLPVHYLRYLKKIKNYNKNN